MKGEKRIYTIAFEGMHRAGKGTQINILAGKLREANIPYVSIRGAGSRTGTGDTGGNPESDYWRNLNKILHSKDAPITAWDEASYRMGRELIVWRDRVLEKEVENALAPFGVLIVDRSLISNAALRSQCITKKLLPITEDDIYPKTVQKRKKIEPKDVLPDMIIELIAPKDVLISRLDHEDQKFEFRKQNIEDKYEYYMQIKHLLPVQIQQRIVTIDSSNSTEAVYAEFARIVSQRFPDLHNKIK